MLNFPEPLSTYQSQIATLLCVFLFGLSAVSNAEVQEGGVLGQDRGQVMQGPRQGLRGTSRAESSATLVRITQQNQSSAEHVGYFLGLLHLALQKTVESHGPYRVEKTGVLSSQARNIARLNRGEDVDVLWSMTSNEREEVMQAIEFPLIKGLMGQRVFLIREGEQARFDGKHDLDSLQRLQAGQGSHWPDTEVLRANKIPVITSTNYELLFPMLKGGRFDYFPRGLHEVDSELALHPKLALEKSLMLEYSAPMYFFVRPGNDRLAGRLLEGLQRAQKDGSFDRYFDSHPVTAQVFERVERSQRRVIHLRNPLLEQQDYYQ